MHSPDAAQTVLSHSASTSQRRHVWLVESQTGDGFAHCALDEQAIQPLTASLHPVSHCTRSYEVPIALQRSATSPRQAAWVAGSQSTAMHVPAYPENAPSTSQNGHAGSVHVPSRQDRGFGSLQPVASATPARS